LIPTDAATDAAIDAATGAAPPRPLLKLQPMQVDTRRTVLRVMPGSLQSNFFYRLDPGMRVLCRVQDGQEICFIGFDGVRLLMMQGSKRHLLKGPSAQAVIQKARAAVGLTYPRLRVQLTLLPRLAPAVPQPGVALASGALPLARGALPADRSTDPPAGLAERWGAWPDSAAGQTHRRATPLVTVVIKRRRSWVATPPGVEAVASLVPAAA
jgi:hypothetical protein